MRVFSARSLLVSAILAVAPPACAATSTPSLSIFSGQDALHDASTQTLLAAHNRYRAEVGVPPLQWSAELAAGAQRWAEHLASSVHRLEHSGTVEAGENLAMWTSGYRTPAQFVDLWADEKPYFITGTFPFVSRLGDWKPVAHYSQMIWRRTTEVGCGFARDRENEFLVCRYSPPGNIIAQNGY